MRSRAHLAFDLGAGSGRAILGALGEDGRLAIEEIRRFPNPMVEEQGRLRWDAAGLEREIVSALGACAAERGAPPRSIGIDTWGVDFGLLDREGRLMAAPHAYRDPRFPAAMDDFLKGFPRERLYDLTGIQILPFNTVFQLHAMARDGGPALQAASDLLMMPDLFAYLLTGVKIAERTIASTTQLVNPRECRWEAEIFDHLGLPLSLVRDVVAPGTVIGRLRREVEERTGLAGVEVAAVAGHDTASAVAAVPARDSAFAYISCGTWSLMGVETPAPVINGKTLALNFTNEGGVFGTFRLLKNIGGLWLLDECRRAWSLPLAEVLARAAAAQPLAFFIDPNSPAFLRPDSMPSAIEGYCRRTGQTVPPGRGAMARSILESLALAHRRVLDEIRVVHASPVERIHLIGGGARNEMLCRFTAAATGLPVLAGPVEAAAIGNLLMQAVAEGRLSSHAELRQVVRESFAPRLYEPERGDEWEEAYRRFAALREP